MANVDNEKIKKAIDNFEEDDFVGAEDTLSKEIKKAKNDYFKDQLGIENDIEKVEDEEEEEEEEEKDNNNNEE